MFYTGTSGFQITFDNGYSVSVKFAPFIGDKVETHSSAEVAVLAPNGDLIPWKDSRDEVQKRCSPSDVVKYINYAMHLDPDYSGCPKCNPHHVDREYNITWVD